MSSSCLENINEVNNKIDLQISKGNEVINYLKGNHSIEEMNKLFISWKKETEASLIEIFGDNAKGRNFNLKTDIVINKFSKEATISILTEAVNTGIDFIRELESEVKKDKSNNTDNGEYLDETSAVIVVKRILKNFYKHIQAMYQDKLHGSCTIKKEHLDAIKIGNEYDVQRILYSIIRPIFPTARLEVVDDAGYNSIRYDIKIDEYNIVIEVKCTRENMTERKLTEELGSDAFHYKSDYLFIFVYDKENIIRNVDLFIRNYKREKSVFGKHIEAIVNQSINI